jgi:GNAT superfamily N-acetyltransferase
MHIITGTLADRVIARDLTPARAKPARSGDHVIDDRVIRKPPAEGWLEVKKTLNSLSEVVLNALFQLLSEAEIPSLLGMMRDFYAQQNMRFESGAAAKAINQLLADPTVGQIYFIYSGPELAGYFALTLCFSLEFHGHVALLDELYLREEFRGRKLGTAAIAFAKTLCKQKGIRALRLEVGDENDAAEGLYRASGFVKDARHLYTQWL